MRQYKKGSKTLFSEKQPFVALMSCSSPGSAPLRLPYFCPPFRHIEGLHVWKEFWEPADTGLNMHLLNAACRFLVLFAKCVYLSAFLPFFPFFPPEPNFSDIIKQ